MASHNPLNGPYFCNASIAYCEHVGVNLHEGNVYGDMNFRYNFTSNISGEMLIFLIISRFVMRRVRNVRLLDSIFFVDVGEDSPDGGLDFRKFRNFIVTVNESDHNSCTVREPLL